VKLQTADEDSVVRAFEREAHSSCSDCLLKDTYSHMLIHVCVCVCVDTCKYMKSGD